MKKIIATLATVFITAALSVSAFAADVSSDTQVAIETNIISDANLDQSAAESKDFLVTKSDVKSFKGKFTDLFAKLNTLRVECKGLWNNIKATNQNIKSEWKVLKESLKGKDKAEAKKILADLKAKIAPLRTQVKTLHSEIKSLREQKTAEWKNFRAAVKSRDELKASSSLNNIINLKKQIIEKQKSLLQTKQEILNLIKT
ncbi:MAG: hypothetical protein N3B21_08605 [Clostridia bacterium]|nr:hypothetical protein [Clostridia bacterium]